MYSPNFRRIFPLPIMLLAWCASPGLALAQANATAPAARDTQYVYHAAGLTFKTARYLEGSKYGLVGNGRADNTRAFQALLGSGNRTIHIAAGTYVTGKLQIPADTVLLLDRGVVIKDSGRLGPHDRLINILHDNVYIRGIGARVMSDRNFYHGGEQRHGVFIQSASNVVIDGLDSSGNSGDGFYIGGGGGAPPARNITLENCTASHNRRNGLSIVSGINVTVRNCTFAYTRGTAPQFGVDLEPDMPRDPLTNIRLIDVRTVDNASGGLSIVLGPAYRPPEPISIDIVNHTSVGENPPFHTRIVARVAGTIIYNGRKTVTP